jgi:sugar phosphate permease
MDNPEFVKQRDSHRWVVFSVICVIYFFVYFHRASTSVIASDLLISFHPNAKILGFMSFIASVSSIYRV